MVGLFAGVALLGEVLQPYDPTAQDLFSANQTFSSEHLLGTDRLGRDTLSRIIAGARTTLVAVTIIIVFASLRRTVPSARFRGISAGGSTRCSCASSTSV